MDEGKDDMGDENANQGNNSSNEEKTDSDGEESDQEDTTPQEDEAGGKTHHEDVGSGGSDGNSFESDAEIKEIKEVSPKKKTSSHTTLPEFDSKAIEEEQQINCCGYACSLGAAFGAWQEKMIETGHKEWPMLDTMTCDHAEHGNKAKDPGPVGVPLGYMVSHEAFKSLKADVYDLCHFYQLGENGDPPPFPMPHEPATRV